MEEGGGLILFIIALIAFIFAVWTAIAALVRVFAWLLVAWIAGFGIGVVGGILTGVVLPPRVLLGKGSTKPEIATPDAVIAGDVMGDKPRGHAEYFGWDRAWPVYNLYQAKRDANAVLGETKRAVNGGFGLPIEIGGVTGLIALLPVSLGFAIGAWASTLAWYVVMVLLGGIVYVIQQVGVLGYRWYERLTRRRRNATLRCAKCYRVTTSPSYRCSNDSCSTVHHDVRPGPLGIVHRRCGCGTSIPATVEAAGKRLVTVCPFCEQDVPEGSGTRRVLSVPVIGAVGAGKTQFLSSAVVELQSQLQARSGSLAPISPVAEAFLQGAAATVASGGSVAKTAWEDRPEGVPFLLTLKGRELEMQLIDAAGENFVDWERSQSLGYINTAEILFFILDPLSLPKIGEEIRLANKAGAVQVAQGDAEDSYASVADRLRAEDISLGKKRLAIVLTKLDVLQTLPCFDALDPADGVSIKAWLRNNGADGFIRRVDQDFKRVEYFAVDSYSPRDGRDPMHPVRVLDWALRATNPRLGVIPRETPVPVGDAA